MSSEIRQLGSRDWVQFRALLDLDLVASCFIAARVGTGLPSAGLGGPVLGWFRSGRLESALALGANLVPVATTAHSRAALADHARRMGRRCSSIVGPAEEVLDLWRLLEPAWGPAREVRAEQPLMAIDEHPRRAPHPDLRPLIPAELDLLMPAAVAMFTEEVGVSPLSHGGGPAYRARLTEIIEAGHALAVVDAEGIAFKAEVGSAAGGVCQVQGVWVDPRRRGKGLGTAGMAGVVAHARAHIAPVVSLYVNDYNAAALATYAAVGFQRVGTFATVLF